MTNSEAKSQYEGAILNQLVKNVEKIAVIEVTVKQNSERLDRIEDKLKQIDTRLDGIDIRLDGIDTRLDGIDTRLDKMDVRLTNLDQRLTNIESLLGWLKVIGSGVVAIALSLIANFIYALIY